MICQSWLSRFLNFPIVQCGLGGQARPIYPKCLNIKWGNYYEKMPKRGNYERKGKGRPQIWTIWLQWVVTKPITPKCPQTPREEIFLLKLFAYNCKMNFQSTCPKFGPHVTSVWEVNSNFTTSENGFSSIWKVLSNRLAKMPHTTHDSNIFPS